MAWSQYNLFRPGGSFADFARLKATEWIWYHRACLAVSDHHVVRFEDFKQDPLACLQRAVEFFGLSYPEERLRAAVDNATFDKAKSSETAYRVAMRSVWTDLTGHAPHHRSGQIGQWQKLPQYAPAFAQVETATRRMRERLGYPI
jgi:hypothetical protein